MTDLADQAQDLAALLNASALRRQLDQAPPAGTPSAAICEACGQPIPEKRRQIVAGVRHCTACQDAIERGMAR